MRRNILLFVGVVALAAAFGCAKKSAEPVSAPVPYDTDAMGAPDPAGIEESDVYAPGRISAPVIHFAFDDYSLSGEARNMLQGFVRDLKAGAPVRLNIEGHCDERGSHEYNLALGERRARAVRNYLQQLGVDARSMNTISYGEERPVDQMSNEEAWRKNRRAEMLITK